MYIQTRKPVKTNSGTQHKSDFLFHSVPMGSTFQLQPVVQRRLAVNGKKIKTTNSSSPYFTSLVEDLYEKISPHFQKKNTLKSDIEKMLFKYISGTMDYEFNNNYDLSRQLVQDIKLKLLKLHGVIGIEHQDGQFSKQVKDDDSQTGRLGRSKPLRIYRTMPAANWNGELESVLNGHGGSLGQALHYFKRSLDNFVTKESTPAYDNILIEIKFGEDAKDLIDYTQISGGGEGAGSTPSGKFTGKSESNDIFGRDEKIFSINLSKNKERIKALHPTVRIIDRVSNYQKTT